MLTPAASPEVQRIQRSAVRDYAFAANSSAEEGRAYEARGWRRMVAGPPRERGWPAAAMAWEWRWPGAHHQDRGAAAADCESLP